MSDQFLGYVFSAVVAQAILLAIRGIWDKGLTWRHVEDASWMFAGAVAMAWSITR